jgi:hypothetical protein
MISEMKGYTPFAMVTPRHCMIYATPCRATRQNDGTLLVSYDDSPKTLRADVEFFASREACLDRCHEMLDEMVERVHEFKKGSPR